MGKSLIKTSLWVSGLLLALSGCGGGGSGTPPPGGETGGVLSLLSQEVVVAPGRLNHVVAEVRNPSGSRADYTLRLEGLPSGLETNEVQVSLEANQTRRVSLEVRAAPQAGRASHQATLKALQGGQTQGTAQVRVEVAPQLIWAVELKPPFFVACQDFNRVVPLGVAASESTVYVVGQTYGGHIYNQPCPPEYDYRGFLLALETLGGSPRFARQWGDNYPALTYPMGVAVDDQGNAYVGSMVNTNGSGNGRLYTDLRKVTPTNQMSLLVRDQEGGVVRLLYDGEKGRFYLAQLLFESTGGTFITITKVAAYSVTGQKLGEREVDRSSSLFLMPTSLVQVGDRLALVYARMEYGGGYSGENRLVFLNPESLEVEPAHPLSNSGILWATPGPEGVYVGGYVQEDLAAPLQGEQDAYLAYYRLDGTRVWHRQEGIAETGTPPWIQDAALPSSDPWGYLYVVFLKGDEVVQAKYDPEGNELYRDPLSSQGIRIAVKTDGIPVPPLAYWHSTGLYLLSQGTDSVPAAVYRLAP